MASEKLVYWMTLSVLALAVTNGFMSDHRGWVDRLADRSVAMVEQASAMATGYANLATPVRRNNDDLKRLVCAQVRLARLQSNLTRRQTEMVRAQVNGIRVRVLEQGIHAAIASPVQNIVIDLPQPPELPQIPENTTF